MYSEYELWALLLDLIGPRNLWPRWMPPLFWKKVPLNGRERFKVAVFCHINGLPLHLLWEWFELKKLFSDNSARDHLKFIWDKFDNDPVYGRRYWSYNIPMGVRMYVNGDTRQY